MQIRTLDSKRVQETAAVLAAAFAQEPVVMQMFSPSDPNRGQKIHDFYVWCLLRTGYNMVDVAIDPLHDSVVGAALWQPPHETPRWYQGLSAWPQAHRAMGKTGRDVLSRFDEASAGKHPEEPHWHLIDIGTAPTARGLGVGTHLLTHRLSIIDAARQHASLEATTQASARLYARFGFTPVHELSGIAEGTTVMWRAASPGNKATAA